MDAALSTSWFDLTAAALWHPFHQHPQTKGDEAETNTRKCRESRRMMSYNSGIGGGSKQRSLHAHKKRKRNKNKKRTEKRIESNYHRKWRKKERICGCLTLVGGGGGGLNIPICKRPEEVRWRGNEIRRIYGVRSTLGGAITGACVTCSKKMARE